MLHKSVWAAFVLAAIGLLGGYPVPANAGAHTNSKLVDLVLSATDNSSGMAEMKFSNDGKTWTVPEAYATSKKDWDITGYGGGSSDGLKTVYVAYKDLSGNWSSSPITDSVTLDRVAPAVIASPDAGTYSTPQTVTLTLSEEGSIYYTTDGSNPTPASPLYTAPITISNTTTLKLLGTDVAGNATTVITKNYTIDILIPIVTATPAGGIYQTAQTIILKMTESGAIYYTLDGSTPTKNSNLYAVPININTNTTLKFFGIDTAGNESAVVTENYKIDTSKPQGTIVINGGATYTNSTNVQLSVSAIDPDTEIVGWLISETKNTKPAPDDSAWQSSAPTLIVLSNGDGEKTLYGWFKDEAGNVNDTAAVDKIILDTTPPTGTVTIKVK